MVVSLSSPVCSCSVQLGLFDSTLTHVRLGVQAFDAIDDDCSGSVSLAEVSRFLGREVQARSRRC